LAGRGKWSLVKGITTYSEYVSEQGAKEKVCTRGGHKMTRGWRRMHDEELHNLYSSPGIIIMIK
jgi:hypothetical protein